jgi:4-alpha-glucanotransferase
MNLAARAAELGVVTEYINARGEHRVVPDESIRLVLEALSASGAATDQSRHLPPFILREGSDRRLRVEPGASGEWALFSAGNEVARGLVSDGYVDVPADMGFGRYRLTWSTDAAGGDSPSEAALVISPRRAYQLDHLQGERVWVLAVQLYAVRSQRNWGHGDFTDLSELLDIAADKGAAGIGLNPLHALFDDRPEQASPYSPNSRLFLNPLYIDIEAVPEFSSLPDEELQGDLDACRNADLVDYTRVANVKMACLRAMHSAFPSSGRSKRRKEFDKFRKERGEALTRFAAFEVLRRRFPQVWWEWDAPWREGGSKALARLRKEAPRELEFYEYIQWIADSQLAACREKAQRLGLGVGLYIDLAVGVDPGGADAWADQSSIMMKVEVGAPPDLLNTAGQAWGLAAFNPRSLETRCFQPFADLLIAAMRHAGAIRLDHVLGLYRLYLIPFGAGAANGAYILFPLEALLACVAVESVKYKCLVIGEDLGTVPGDFRERLANWGIWSYQVMLFERWDDGSFKRPHDYKGDALITFSTHDLPTFTGWESAHDMRVKWSLGIDPGESDEAREDARNRVRQALGEQGLGEGGLTLSNVIRYLARSPSRLLVVEIDDVLALQDQPNVPGTVLEHPNWRRRLPVSLESLREHPDLNNVSQILAQENRSSQAG